MKTPLYVVILLLAGCNNSVRKEKSFKETDSSGVSSVKTMPGTPSKDDTNTVFVYLEEYDTVAFTKGELKSIIEFYPELNSSVTYSPDETYARSSYKCKPDPGNPDRISFSSEVGRDTYYSLYAYFLKSRNGIEKYRQQRKDLIEIYRDINTIYGRFSHGGTYFGHQYRRIAGYAEYSVYLYANKYDWYDARYNIAMQKKLFLTSLQQEIIDEISVDHETDNIGRIKEKQELLGIVADLNKLITNLFYLKRALEFQHSNY